MKKIEHPLYTRWKAIMERCYKKHNKNYKFYRSKGVTVDERWHELWNFVYDVDNHLLNGHLLYKHGYQLPLEKFVGRTPLLILLYLFIQ
jgi:hypothetical protein